ncbi:TldD/PmbA family protein [Sedimentibacter sp. zth1]|uniref:TldD/PmbA family protein n=1 Tax=Sedimentibacter sp. zth1 TaxID=2816908 RepID=UPI001A9323B4|nr:TldD/PmbA family protein [Sedimentibacter sp. zth1]QSX07088.1 TldD/PmbA family protein [Sedimentibacter sp. zth1]
MLEDKLKNSISLFKDNVHTELRASENRKRLVKLIGGNITSNIRTEESGVCARVYKNGLYGFSSVAEYNDEAIKKVLNKANENACFMSKHIDKNKPNLDLLNKGVYNTDIIIKEIEQKKYIEFLKELDNYIVTKYPLLKSRSLTMTEDSMEKLLYVSSGYNGHTAMPRSYIYITLITEAGDGTPVELTHIVGDFGIFTDNFKNPESLYKDIDKLYEMLMKKREGVHAKAGYQTVILGGDLSGMLAHEAVGHTVEADLVLGGSVAAHNLNKKIGSDLVNLVDFAHTALGKRAPLPVYVDDEGVKAEDTVIIENGVLKQYMNNRETAKHFGMCPRGNASAFKFSDEPLIRMRNTAFLPGKNTLDDLIASVEDGYYFTHTNNGQADTTSEFMFGVCMGYEIKKGKLGKAVLDTTISGVAFDMLKTVDMLSNNMNWLSAGFCGKKQPMPGGIGGPEMRCKLMIGGR